MKIWRLHMRKFIIFSIALIFILSFFVPNVLAQSEMGGIYYYSNRWVRSEQVLKNIFVDYNIIPMESDPFDYLNNGAKAVEVMDSEYGFIKDNYYSYPLYKLTPIIAINRDKTNINIETWSDLTKYDVTVGMEEYTEYSILGMNQGLDKNKSNFDKSTKLLKEIKANGNLIFLPKKDFSISDIPDVVILYDNHAKILNSMGANLEVVIPTEGTVSFGYSLFSNEPLDLNGEILFEELEKNGFNTSFSNEEDNITKINSSIYMDIIRAESMVNRELIKPFRPLRTNKFENAITYVLLFLIIGILSAYFYFRITTEDLRNYIFFVFSLLCFWIIVRMSRLLLSNREIVHRYAWYLYYVAMIYIPMLFVWISFSVEERLEERKFSVYRKISFIYSTILLVFVLTNDLHNLVFKFHTGNDDYSFNYVMIVILLNYVVSIFISFGVLIKKAISMPKRRQLIIPSIFVLSLLVYIIIFNVYLNNKIAVELTKTVTLIIVLLTVFSMRFGLIPINRMHIPIFQKSRISLEIRDKTEKTLIKSDAGKDFEVFLMKRKPIQGGFAVWYEDLTFLNKLLSKEEELNEKLEENVEILKRRYEVEKQLEALSKKEQLQKTVEVAIQEDLEQLDKEIKLLENLDKEERKFRLTVLALDLVRLKYISNLLIISLTNNVIEVEDMLIYLNSLSKIVNNIGIDCNIYNHGKGNITFTAANKMLNWFVESLINGIGSEKEISCVTYFDEDKSTMMLYTDRDKIDFNPFLPKSKGVKKPNIPAEEVIIQENEFMYKGTMKISRVII